MQYASLNVNVFQANQIVMHVTDKTDANAENGNNYSPVLLLHTSTFNSFQLAFSFALYLSLYALQFYMHCEQMKRRRCEGTTTVLVVTMVV